MAHSTPPYSLRVLEPDAWPHPPAWMSYSTLREIESCPRRWALLSAEYSAIWSRTGYPRRPHLPAIIGTIVHRCIKKIVHAVTVAGCPSVKQPEAVSVLRGLGGYSQIVSSCAHDVLAHFDGNPRADRIREFLSRAVESKSAAMRQHVQLLISGLRLVPRARHTDVVEPSENLRRQLSKGSYPEVELRVDHLRWKGIADLINLSDDGCEIIDFKTALPSPDHEFQLRVYSLLWSRDLVLNPTQMPAIKLTLCYSDGEVAVHALSNTELAELEEDITDRTAAVEAMLYAFPPAARPSEDNCRYCSVRHLCEAYWTACAQTCSPLEVPEGHSVDIELILSGRHGPTSWDAVGRVANCAGLNTEILVRDLPPELDVQIGSVLRLLGCYAIPDIAPVVTVSAVTEAFLVQ